MFEKAIQYESRLRYTEAKCELRNMWNLWMEVGEHYVEAAVHKVHNC